MHTTRLAPNEAANAADGLLNRFLKGSSDASRKLAALKRARSQWNDAENGLSGSAARTRSVLHAHATLAQDLKLWVQESLSGSDRAWSVLTKLHQDGNIHPLEVPYIQNGKGGIDFDFSRIDQLKNDIVLLRRNLDLARIFTGGVSRRLTLSLSSFEGARLHCVAVAHEISEKFASEMDHFDAVTNENQSKYRTQLAGIGAELSNEIDDVRGSFETVIRSVGPGAVESWEAAELQKWEPPETVVPQHIGQLRYDNPELSEITRTSLQVPLLKDIRKLGNVLHPYSGETADREALDAVVRNFLARTMCSFPPKNLRIGVIDPLGMGNAVSRFIRLGDYNPELISGKVRSNTESIKDLLNTLTAHIEVVVQKYLRGTYNSLAEYNEEAGEVAEAYRLLIVQDFPKLFDDDMLHQLQRIIEHGPKCGIFTLVTANTDSDADDFRRIDISHLPQDSMAITNADFAPVSTSQLGDSAWLTELSKDPISELGEEEGGAVIDQIVDKIGSSSRTLDIDTAIEKTFSKFSEVVAAGTKSELRPDLKVPDLGDPETWWQNRTSENVVAPFGRSGATEVATLRLDSGNLTGALIVGRPGSGKSTLIHTVLAGLTTMYGPDELELYLLDFKEGVEFADYAEHGLPHASCIAVESERELGMNVLQSLEHELKSRADTFKAAKVQNIGGYRDLGHEMTRIVVFFDEFQVLFNDDDRVGQSAAKSLDQIIKQGRSHGIHIVLSSQTLSGMIAINKQSLQLLNVRVLLPSSTEDAMTVMDDHNPAHRLISSRGEGILNNESGREAANVHFKGAYEESTARKNRLDLMRVKAEAEGFSRKPRIFESGTQAHLEEAEMARFTPGSTEDPQSQSKPVVLRPGDAFSLHSDYYVELKREAGSNIIHVDRNVSDQLVGTMTALWLSARASNPFTTHEIIAFSHILPALQQVINALVDQGAATQHSGKNAESALASVAAEMDRRQEEQDFSSAPILLTLYGLQKARDLDPNSFSASMSFEDEPSLSLHELIERIASEGPEVGVHIVATVDTTQGLEKRLSRKVQHEFSFRLIGSMSNEDIGQLTSATVRVRPDQGQMLYYDLDTGETKKYLPYVLNDTDWAAKALTQGETV